MAGGSLKTVACWGIAFNVQARHDSLILPRRQPRFLLPSLTANSHLGCHRQKHRDKREFASTLSNDAFAGKQTGGTRASYCELNIASLL
jgi:hypothetical protein